MNVIERTNVPDVRLKFRRQCLGDELRLLRASHNESMAKFFDGLTLRTVSDHPESENLSHHSSFVIPAITRQPPEMCLDVASAQYHDCEELPESVIGASGVAGEFSESEARAFLLPGTSRDKTASNGLLNELDKLMKWKLSGLLTDTEFLRAKTFLLLEKQ